jgi:hypothetical protein
MPDDEWSRRSRFSKLSSVLYPHLASEKCRAQMAERARNEGKRPPTTARLLDHHSRGATSPLDGRIKR